MGCTHSLVCVGESGGEILVVQFEQPSTQYAGLGDILHRKITVVDTSVSLLCSVTYSPSGLSLFQPTCLPLGRKDGCCHWSNGLTSHLIVKVHNIGVYGIQWLIWLESTLFTVRIKLCFHTSYLGSFLNKACCHRLTMMSLLELLSLMKYHKTLEPRKHHKIIKIYNQLLNISSCRLFYDMKFFVKYTNNSSGQCFYNVLLLWKWVNLAMKFVLKSKESTSNQCASEVSPAYFSSVTTFFVTPRVTTLN